MWLKDHRLKPVPQVRSDREGIHNLWHRLQPVICGAAIIFSALGSRAQDSPTFQVGTKLVQVDVIVRDAKGPVRDLKKEDFTLFDKGKPQKIEVFSIRTTPAQPPPPSRQAPGVVSN